jgi:pimeloyl-ACP methyl ester carboxylesterase
VGVIRRLPFVLGHMARRPLSAGMIRAWTQPVLSDRAVRRDLAKYVRSRDLKSLADACERLRSFDRPALVAWATDDRVMPVAHGRRLAELMPHARYEEIADSYTLIPHDQPVRLADLIRRFVGAGDTAAATTPVLAAG